MRNIMRRESASAPAVERLFNSMFSDPFFESALPAFISAREEGTLALDVSENESEVTVRASLPGFNKENVSIEVHDGVLTIKAEHAEEHEDKGERFYRRERQFGSVSRRVALPSPVLEDQARAELKDGVLTLHLPKTRQPNPKKIAIE